MSTQLFVIEDDYIFRLIIKKMLDNVNDVSFLLQECENGEIGINKISKLKGTKEKVIILLDINMPVLNGWGFLDKLKEQSNFFINDISVFIVSSSTNQADFNKASEYQVVKQFLQKPINLDTLKKILYFHLQ